MTSGRGTTQSSLKRRTEFRTRAGCLTCKARRKKCDEKKPTCTGCARNFINCKWREVTPVRRQRACARASERGSENRPSPESASARWCAPTLTSPRHLIGRSVVIFSARQSFSPPHDTQDSQKDIEDQLEAIDSINTDDPGCLTRWCLSTSTFQSAERAVLLTPKSPLFLEHYLENTSVWLVPRPRALNPFISFVLPLAHADDMLMHAILTLSGIHLGSHKHPDPSIQLSTRKHYTLLLRGLRLGLAENSQQTIFERTARLLLALVILCLIEASSAGVQCGIFPHLRAARLLVVQLLETPQRNYDADTKTTLGLALETFAYLVLINCITPYGQTESRTIPFDPFLASVDCLKQYETFGVFLACGQGLFEHIPAISIFATTRLNEEKGLDACASESDVTYKSILAALSNWTSPPISPDMAKFEHEHCVAGKIYQQSLLLFLKASMYGSVVNTPKAIMDIQRHINAVFDMFGSILGSPFATIMLWPLLIVGSCCICERQCEQILRILRREGPGEFFHVTQASNLLQKLWADPDKRAYGPFGLNFIMHKYGIIFSMA